MGGNKKKGKSAPQATAVGVSADAISIVTTVAGDGASIPMDGDEVTVHYVGSLVSDGSMFDSSRKKKMPFVFKLGSGAVIKGWDMGVAQMSLGQRVKLKISSPAAYGAAGCTDKVNASGTGVIPPNADLLFDVELLDINHKKSVAALAKYRQTLDGEKGAKPAGVCGGCGEDAQTNFLRVVAADGKALPWIEHAPLTAAQEEKAGEARAAAAAAEVS